MMAPLRWTGREIHEFDFGACSVIVVPLAPQTPILASPAKDATNAAVSLTLNWNAASSFASYDVYVGTTTPPPWGNRNLYAVLAELTNAGNHVLLDGDCKESFRLRVFSNPVIYDWRANGVPIDADRWDRPTGILGRRRACAQCAIFRSLGCGSRFDG